MHWHRIQLNYPPTDCSKVHLSSIQNWSTMRPSGYGSLRMHSISCTERTTTTRVCISRLPISVPCIRLSISICRKIRKISPTNPNNWFCTTDWMRLPMHRTTRSLQACFQWWFSGGLGGRPQTPADPNFHSGMTLLWINWKHKGQKNCREILTVCKKDKYLWLRTW